MASSWLALWLDAFSSTGLSVLSPWDDAPGVWAVYHHSKHAVNRGKHAGRSWLRDRQVGTHGFTTIRNSCSLDYGTYGATS